MSTRNDHVFDCLNEDLPESFFFKEVELLLLIVTLTQKKNGSGSIENSHCSQKSLQNVPSFLTFIL